MSRRIYSRASIRQFQHRLGGLGEGDAVAATVAGGVDRERVQLVQRDALAPAAAERRGAVVGREHVVEERAAEEGEHGEIGLAVAAVRRGIDEHHSRGATRARCRSRGRRAGAPAARRRRTRPAAITSAARRTSRPSAGVVFADLLGDLEVGQHAVAGVEPPPRRLRRGGQWTAADEERPVPAVRWRAECACARRVRPREGFAERACRRATRTHLVDALELDPARRDVGHRDRAHPAGGREPGEPGRLGLEEAFGSVRASLEDGVHPPSVPTAARTQKGGGADRHPRPDSAARAYSSPAVSRGRRRCR